jgi:hypothetical protein
VREFYLDFRPVGRVWSNRGIRMTDEETARRLLEKIRDQVAESVSVEETSLQRIGRISGSSRSDNPQGDNSPGDLNLPRP